MANQPFFPGNRPVVTTIMSALFYLFILVVFIQRNSEAAPVEDYDDDDIPSGVLKAISGVVPISAHRNKQNIQNEILKEIRRRVDQVDVSELDSSVRDDISQDELSPLECAHKYGIRDGALKHIIRGAKAVGGVLVKDIETLAKGRLAGLPLVPNVINGAGGLLQYILCGIEDAASDIVSSGLDEGADLVTKLLVDLLDIEGSAPLQNVPAGIMNITKLVGQVGSEAVEDIFLGIEEGIEDIAAEVTSGIQGVAQDVGTDVSNVVSDVKGVLNGVQTDVSSVAHYLGTDVSNVVSHVKGVLNGVQTDVSSAVIGAKADVSNLINNVQGAVSGVETDVTGTVNAVDMALQMIKGGVGSGVGSIVGGVKGGLGTVKRLLG